MAVKTIEHPSIDFDQTLPGPFEYDVKQMAASFTIAARNNACAKADTRGATLASVRYERDFGDFVAAVRSGRLKAVEGV